MASDVSVHDVSVHDAISALAAREGINGVATLSPRLGDAVRKDLPCRCQKILADIQIQVHGFKRVVLHL